MRSQTLRQHEMQMYIGIITLITLYVLNLLAQRWPPTLSESNIHRITVVLRTTRNFISVECGMGYHTPKTTIPYQTPSPLHFMTQFSIQKALKLCPAHRHQIIWCGCCSQRNILPSSDNLLKDACSIFLWNTTTQTTWYPNLNHTMFLHHCENLK
jgi:hypothetical protein